MLLEVMNAIMKFIQHNWLATLYINFKMLPLRQAIHLPIDVCHQVRFESLKGKFVLDKALPLHRAMVRIGGRGSDIFPRTQTVLCIDGEVYFGGDHIEIGNGTSLIVTDGGRLSFGEKVRMGARTKIYCTKAISFANEIDLSWECQVFDTNFHYMQRTDTNEIVSPSGSVSIGNNVWIGNRCTVSKGTILPADIIVASNSLLNKDYSDVPAFSMLAGLPATVVKAEVKRLFEGKDL